MQTCLVLGAGASLANAQYFRPLRMQETHPPLDATFFRTVRARKIQLPSELRAYVRGLTGGEGTINELLPQRMEDFFKDLFFDFQDSPNDSQTRAAYTELVDLYARVLRDTTNWLCDDGRSGGPVGRLIGAAAEVADRLTLITFNHDLVIENEIDRRARLRLRWCTDEGYGNLSARLGALTNPSGQAVLRRHGSECEHSRPIVLPKLHGSLNWVVRIQSDQPTARMLSGEGGDRQVYLLPWRRIPASRTRISRGGSGRGRSVWNTWPVIVPPVYAKQALRKGVHEAWEDARSAIEGADRIVSFGYSLPDIDIEAEKLFERALAANASARWIDVIDPAPISAQRYASLSSARVVRWYQSLDDFMAAGALI